MRGSVWALAVLVLWGNPSIAAAACGTGQPPSYDDIDAVMLKQTGCKGALHPKTPKSFECSYFWALVWDGEPSEYSQYNLPGSIGLFEISTSIADVRSILSKDNFFALSPPDYEVTDTTESVVSVKRCAVTTRIRMYNTPMAEEPATARLFADLRHLFRIAEKTRKSFAPKDFQYTLLFDP
jgi:hypothetical protein